MPYFPKVHMQWKEIGRRRYTLCGRMLFDKNPGPHEGRPRVKNRADINLTVQAHEGWSAVNCDACLNSDRVPEPYLDAQLELPFMGP
jgi:hypothetical protein